MCQYSKVNCIIKNDFMQYDSQINSPILFYFFTVLV